MTQQFDSDLKRKSEERECNDLHIEEAKIEKRETPEPNQEREKEPNQSSLSNATEIITETKEKQNGLEYRDENHTEDILIKQAESSDDESDEAKLTEYFIEEETRRIRDENQNSQETTLILEDAIKEDSPEHTNDDEQENASVKVRYIFEDELLLADYLIFWFLIF